ncbi:DUF2637 domain-containing protein [Streptomyces sp. Isolate_45]|uniref:DUF2637 domain-containing protein n=1 Tax=Streptomyces sp. Isolate_45 TaxID=2950111 RepID=UPI002481EF58|nr:DUF2637 domain-containing protein [Streptomyces sp. Isolate_45]MDA5284634.1 DUF2637 domain-containing protein [Streptomyces sp. Isolate_45]
MATAAMPLAGAEPRPVPAVPSPVPVARPTVPAVPADVPAKPKRDRAGLAGRALLAVVVLGGAALAAIGFAGSYASLEALAVKKGFGDFAPWFPIGVDAGIIVALAADLYLVRRGMSWPFLRPLAHGLTVATVWFNASAGPRSPMQDPVAAAMHAVMPILFVAVVEACRFLVIRTARLDAGQDDNAAIPRHRWILSPYRTFGMWRNLKLWALATYEEVVKLEQDRRVYRVMLIQKHGSVRKAPEVERLPLTMARYGLSVEAALALPRQAAEREQRRRDAEEAAKVQAEALKAQRAAQADIARIRADGMVQAAQHEVTASTQQAAVTARAELVAAERAAETEAQALESAVAAEAEARRVRAIKEAAEDREQAAGIAARAAEIEETAAGMERRAAEIAEQTAKANARAEAYRKQAVEDEKHATETAAHVAEMRLRIAGIEKRAAEVEDEARLSQKDRNVLRVARRALLENGDVETIPLEAIVEEFGVSTTTASNYRKWAAEKIAEGYRPEGI